MKLSTIKLPNVWMKVSMQFNQWMLFTYNVHNYNLKIILNSVKRSENSSTWIYFILANEEKDDCGIGGAFFKCIWLTFGPMTA